MAVDAGPALVLTAGAMTFGNEFLQTGTVNFRVPIAALLGAAVIGLLSSFSPNAGTAIGGMVLIGAATTKFNGKSVVQELTASLNGNGTVQQRKKGK